MKNKTRRPPLIIHPAPKQNQQDFLKTKLETDSPFTASQPPTSPRLSVPSDFGPNMCKYDQRASSEYNVESTTGFACHIQVLCVTTYQLGLNIGPNNKTT